MTQVMTPRGRRFLARLEGERRNADGLHIPYLDSAGKWTIGRGHLIRPHERFTTLTDDQADLLLQDDVRPCEAAVRRYFADDVLAPHEFDALAIFIFNIGTGPRGWDGDCTPRKALLESPPDRARAAAGFALWNKEADPDNPGRLRVSPGLVNRRAKEAALFASADYDGVA